MSKIRSLCEALKTISLELEHIEVGAAVRFHEANESGGKDAEMNMRYHIDKVIPNDLLEDAKDLASRLEQWRSTKLDLMPWE